jgi:hypothetical protein
MEDRDRPKVRLGENALAEHPANLRGRARE